MVSLGLAEGHHLCRLLEWLRIDESFEPLVCCIATCSGSQRTRFTLRKMYSDTERISKRIRRGNGAQQSVQRNLDFANYIFTCTRSDIRLRLKVDHCVADSFVPDPISYSAIEQPVVKVGSRDRSMQGKTSGDCRQWRFKERQSLIRLISSTLTLACSRSFSTLDESTLCVHDQKLGI